MDGVNAKVVGAAAMLCTAAVVGGVSSMLLGRCCLSSSARQPELASELRLQMMIASALSETVPLICAIVGLFIIFFKL